MENSKSIFNIFNKFFLLGFIISITFFIIMEISWPYTFLKDDNVNQFLPVILEGMKQLFSGTLPVFNQFQATGSPILEYGTYNVLYPPMILSYFISSYFFKNLFYTIEIFVLLHILLAYLFTYLFLVCRGTSKIVAMMGSISFVFSGYVIAATSNWYYVIPTATFLPLILYLNHRIMESNKNIKLYILLGFVRGLYFYAGNTQFFLYSLLFELFYVFLFYYKKNRSILPNLEMYFISFLITFGLASPLAFGQIGILKDSSRIDPSIFSYLFSYYSRPIDLFLGQILPYPIFKSQNGLGNSPESFSEIYYSGTLFFIFALIGCYYSFKNNKIRLIKKLDPLLLLGIFSILFSMGLYGIIYIFGFFIPIFKSFLAPFRFTIFTLFFINCFGALTLSKILSLPKFKIIKKYIFSILFFLFFILMFYHVVVISHTAWSYPTDIIPLNLSLPIDLSSGRLISLTYPNIHNLKLSNLDYMMYNYPTYFGVYHISGYESFFDKLVEKNTFINRPLRGANFDLENLAEYGVKWILLPTDSLSLYPQLNNLFVVYSNTEFTILKINNSKPFVFAEEGTYINHKVLPDGFVFFTNFSENKNVVVNTIYRDNFDVRVNGAEIQKQTDVFDRLKINVPSGYNEVFVIYKPKLFFYGFYFGILILFFVFMYIRFLMPIITNRMNLSIKKLNKLFIKKYVILIIMVLFIMFLIFCFYSFASASSFERELKSITGMNFEIGKVKFLSLSHVKLENLKVIEPLTKNTIFYSESVLVDFDFSKSISSVLHSENKGIYLKRIYFDNFYFNASNFFDLFYVGSLDTCNQDNVLDSGYSNVQMDRNFTYSGNISMYDVFISPKTPVFFVKSVFVDFDNRNKVDKITGTLKKIRRRYYFNGYLNNVDYFGQCFVLDNRNKLYSKNLYLV